MAEVIKKVIVFGATGNTGLAILRCAVAEKLDVTAYVRTPSKIPENVRDMVKIVVGDILDKEKVEKALDGQDAVLSALGTGWNLGETTVISGGCKNIVEGMKKHNIKKLVVVSVAFLLPGRSTIFFLRKVTEDHARQLKVLKAETESIDWIAMMAPRIANSTAIDTAYMVEKDTIPGVNKVTTAELADYMVKILNDHDRFKDFTHSMPGISSSPSRKWWPF